MQAAAPLPLPGQARAAAAAPDGDERGQPQPEGGGRHQQTEEEHAQAEEWKANLRWVLAALAPRRSSRRLVLVLVLAHLRRPTSRINISACLPCPSSAFSLETHASIMHSLPLLCIFLQLPPLSLLLLSLVVSYVKVATVSRSYPPLYLLMFFSFFILLPCLHCIALHAVFSLVHIFFFPRERERERKKRSSQTMHEWFLFF
jgi:hypothetical protein